MADDASVTVQATVLPDEIAKTISGSMTIAPADANDKWYYKLTSVSNSSTDLIAGYFTDYTAVDDDTAPTAVATADKVNFLFIKNTDASNDVYIVLDAGTASTSAGDAIKIKDGHSWYGIYTAPTSTTTVFIGLTIANIAASQITVDIKLSAASTVFLVKDVPILAGASLEFMAGNKIIMEAGHTISVTSNTANSADSTLSIMEIT